jgi:hypothetical protein
VSYCSTTAPGKDPLAVKINNNNNKTIFGAVEEIRTFPMLHVTLLYSNE